MNVDPASERPAGQVPDEDRPPAEIRTLCIADYVGTKRDGGSMRLHELMKSVCAMGPSHLLLLNPVDDDAKHMVAKSLAVPVTAIRTEVVGRWRALAHWLRHPSMPWEVARLDRQNLSPQIAALVTELSPNLIWTTSVKGWDSLSVACRQKSVVDLIDGFSVADSMMVRLSIRRWTRRGYFRLIGRPMWDAPGTPRVRDFLKHLDGAIRGPSLERFLTRNSRAVIVSHRVGCRYSQMLIVPNGFDPVKVRRTGVFNETRFVFPANFRYEPNLDGAEWFIQSILPRLREEAGGPRVIFAGAVRDGLALYGKRNGVEVLGPFESLDQLVDDESVVIVPLLAGTGTRLKILEAWSMGLPVVSTTVGAEGLGAVDRENILLADSAASFAAACTEVARSKSLRERIALGGLETVEAFRWGAITEELQRTVALMVSDRADASEVSMSCRPADERDTHRPA